MGRRRKRLPRGQFQVTIESLTDDGRGLARMEDKVVFLHGGLPEETVSFEYRNRHRRYDEGDVVEVLQPSADRVSPDCPHFGVCGGCVLQHLDTRRQIEIKQQWLINNLHHIGKVKPKDLWSPLTGPFWHYRYKARLGVKYVDKKERLLIGFRERGKAYVADLHQCSVLEQRISLDTLTDCISRLSIYRQLPQIEVAGGDEYMALILRVLAPLTEDDRKILCRFAEQNQCQLYLQPAGPDTIAPLWPENPEDLSYRLPEQQLSIAFKPWQFTQVNPDLNRKMINQALNFLNLNREQRVLDLFCGVGNFSLPLARHAGQVVAVEGLSSLVEQGRVNAKNNGMDNVTFHCADLTLPSEQQTWFQGKFDALLLDPPRSGALEILPLVNASGANRVLYVSCHPATLARDAHELVHSYGFRLRGAGVMDMFPHTAHVESMALFER